MGVFGFVLLLVFFVWLVLCFVGFILPFLVCLLVLF